MISLRRERILYTRYDGGVNICHPAAECMRWMTGGGGYWDHMPRGYMEIQIERQIEAGHHARAARRFAEAMVVGGCTDAEALDIIRDRDCGHRGTAFELLDISKVPTDRWFRDAWRRSHNGGPIYVDMPKARALQEKKIRTLLRGRDIEFRRGLWRARLHRAVTPNELKSVWPQRMSRIHVSEKQNYATMTLTRA